MCQKKRRSEQLPVVYCLLPVSQKREWCDSPRPFPACCLRPEVLPARRSVSVAAKFQLRRAETCSPCDQRGKDTLIRPYLRGFYVAPPSPVRAQLQTFSPNTPILQHPNTPIPIMRSVRRAQRPENFIELRAHRKIQCFAARQFLEKPSIVGVFQIPRLGHLSKDSIHQIGRAHV